MGDSVKIGLFDHIEDGERPWRSSTTSGLQFAAAADSCRHLLPACRRAPRHTAELGSGAGHLSRRRRRARPSTAVGPLVYLLPLYSPLRLIEEICMLDHLSHGRLDIGVGRGVSPYELEFHNVVARRFARNFFRGHTSASASGLTIGDVQLQKQRYLYNDVPIALRPLQQPHPPFWYASTNARARPGPASTALHYRDAWARRRWRRPPSTAYKTCSRQTRRRRPAEAGIFRRRGVIGVQRPHHGCRQ